MSQCQKVLFTLWISWLFQNPLAQAVQTEKGISLIPAGDFLMGTREGAERERPVHTVYLKEYRISQFEVNNLEFEKFQPTHKRSASSFCDQCPVTMITWFDASSYCNNQKGRLPTEAEWEKAGRGPAGHPYSFGSKPDQSKSNYGREFQAGAKAVNSFQPNGFGLYNMSGNVWEWVKDWFAFYAIAGLEKSKNLKNSNEKVVRGGSWYNSTYYVNLGMRFKLHPHMKLNSIGFRCVWDIQ